MLRQLNFRKFDWMMALTVIILCIIGIVAIGSATRINSPDGTTEYVSKQIQGVGLGLAAMLFLIFFDYKMIGKLFPLVFIVNVGLLLSVYVFGFSSNNATRWVNIAGISLQPSELAKLLMIIVVAKLMQIFDGKINRPHVLLILFAAVLVPVSLVFIQPALSTSVVILAIFLFMLYAGGISYLYILGGLGIAIPAALFGFAYIKRPDQVLLKPYQVRRIMSLIYPEQFDPDVLWQTNNSIQAIGSGQMFGKGLYLGKINQYDYLPEPQTDFIFSIIGEEFGFIGCVFIIGLILFLIVRLLWMAKDVEDIFGRLVIVGVVAILTIQTFINVGVATGILPNTGIPLPFISSGLSGLLTIMFGFGIVLNIGMQRK